ncbi:hypothetical protein SDC9_188105 [bioreactor metagenome]|uniref:Uncharacterized protein n=1 Tax=bioreactor metagenome TaxID=1076179 RepID=A0A645HNN4_9ZZZZ
MEKRLEKLAGALSQMTPRLITASAMVCYLVASFSQLPVIAADEVSSQADKYAALGVGEKQEVIRINQLAVETDRTGIIPGGVEQFHGRNCPQQLNGEPVEAAAPADIIAEQPIAKSDRDQELQMDANPCDQRLQQLEKDIHKTCLLSVFLIFFAGIMLRK